MPCFVDQACFLGNRMLDNELCVYRKALEKMGSLKFRGVLLGHWEAPCPS